MEELRWKNLRPERVPAEGWEGSLGRNPLVHRSSLDTSMVPDAPEGFHVDHWKKLLDPGWNPKSKDLWLDFLFPVSVRHPQLSGLLPSEM